MTEPRYGPSVRVGADAGPRIMESEDTRQRRREREKKLQGDAAFWAEYHRRMKLREERREHVRRLAGWTHVPQFSNHYSELLDHIVNKPNKKGK